jgi:hypothetical protein
MDRIWTSISLLPLPPKSSGKALWPHITLTTETRAISHTTPTAITTAELTFLELGTTQCQDRIPTMPKMITTLIDTSSVLVPTPRTAPRPLHPPSPTTHCPQRQTTLPLPRPHTPLVSDPTAVATTCQASAT